MTKSEKQLTVYDMRPERSLPLAISHALDTDLSQMTAVGHSQSLSRVRLLWKFMVDHAKYA